MLRALSVHPQSLSVQSGPSWSRWLVCMLLLGALTVFPDVVLGQEPLFEQGGTTATVPANNEAMLLVSRIEQAIRQGDWQMALVLRERVLNFSADLVIAPVARTYLPVWRRVGELFEQLPAPGREQFRQLYEADAAAHWRKARQTGDLDMLRTLFREYRGLETWPMVGGELATRLIDQGEYGEAIEVIRLLEDAGLLEPPQRAQLVVALAQLGYWQAAQAELNKLAADSGLPQWSGSEERMAALRRWIDIRLQSSSRVKIAPGDELEPALNIGPRWIQELQPVEPCGYYEEDVVIAEVARRWHRPVLHTPIVDEDTLFVRLRGTIWAFDALALTPRWRVREVVRGGHESDDQGGGGAGTAGAEAGRYAGEHANKTTALDTSVLLSHALRHSLSTAFGLVFTIEGLAGPLAEPTDSYGIRWGEQTRPVANELIARDPRTGELVWRLGHESADPLHGVAFQDCPIAVGRYLCVPFQRGRELCLCVLEPSSGEVLREISVVGPPIYFAPMGGRCLLSADETSLYVCTGNGVIGAFSQAELGSVCTKPGRYAWKWATKYPSTLAERRSAAWWAPRDELREFGVDRPLVAGDLLILAPVDCPVILALDRSSGRERWRIERGANDYLVGSVAAGIVLGGDSIICLDPADGRTLRWRSVPLEPTGKPTVYNERIFVPTQTGIVALDGRTGKVVAAPVNGEPTGGRMMAANLVASPTALFAVSPNALVKYPDMVATRRQCETLLVKDKRPVQSPAATSSVGPVSNRSEQRAWLAQVWLDVLEQDYGPALTKLEQFQTTDLALINARERLLTDIFVALSGESGGGQERLAWLRRAARQTASAKDSAKLAVLIGQALEESQAKDEVVEHYAGLLEEQQPVLIVVGDDPGHQVALWLHAVARLRATNLLTDSLERWIDSASPEFLQRLRLAMGRPVRSPAATSKWVEQIDRNLALSGLPPELLIRYLPSQDNLDLPLDLRRRLHLARWETYVALGLVEQGQADQRYWRENFAAGQKEESGVGSGNESKRVQRIEKSLAKLVDLVGKPFDQGSINRQWMIRDAELVGDLSRGGKPNRPWILTRKLDDLVIGLHSTVLGRQWHRTVAALESDRLVDLDQTADAIFADSSDEGHNPSTTWPAVLFEYLAAMPVHNGLVCVGLGPERRADRRLWEHAIPQWNTIPTNFAKTTVAGTSGVYLTPRYDRVVLIGWADGRIWWQRSFPGLRIKELFLVDEPRASASAVAQRLIIVGQGGEVASVDPLFGDDLRVLSPGGATPRAVAGVADTVIIWGQESLAGLDPLSLECRWTRACHGIEAWAEVPHADWFAYRSPAETDWQLLSAQTGEPVFARALGDVGQTITAAAIDRQQMLVASFSRILVDEEVTPVVRLTAFDRQSGQQRWTCEIKSRARVNLTQLLAHRELIPVLVARSEYGLSDVSDYDTLAICLVDKQSGVAGEPRSIMDDFRSGRGVCEATMLATPSRIIVQAAGNLAAYGTSSKGPGR